MDPLPKKRLKTDPLDAESRRDISSDKNENGGDELACDEDVIKKFLVNGKIFVRILARVRILIKVEMIQKLGGLGVSIL
jgi:hypothetical protein